MLIMHVNLQRTQDSRQTCSIVSKSHNFSCAPSHSS